MARKKGLPVRLIGIVGIIVIILAFMPLIGGINDAGHRTVIQYPTGGLKVKFTPGFYLQLFGKVDVYNDVITYDFDKTLAEGDSATIDKEGINVRYQDGGRGTIFGKARFSLPTDESTMILLHKDNRSNIGIANKVIKPDIESSMNLTAGLMTSEEAYAEKRAVFIDWAKSQTEYGNFQTILKSVLTSEEGTGKQIYKKVPEIKLHPETKQPMHQPSNLTKYGITLASFAITDWDFEQKTLDQIARKRQATMAIITAKADAEAAKQEAITAEEQGKKNVMTAKYEKMVEKEKAVVDAERLKEVAVIKAKQLVDVAEQQKLEAEQKKLAAVEYKQEQILRGEGDAQYKRLVIEADGALEQKLKTYERVANIYASAIAQQKWVPEIQMGSNSDSSGNSANDLINLLTTKAAKDLSLDMTVRE